MALSELDRRTIKGIWGESPRFSIFNKRELASLTVLKSKIQAQRDFRRHLEVREGG